MDKPVVSFKPPKFTKRVQTWNLLFVDNYGKTRQIKWFKGLVIFFMVFLAIAVMGNVFLYMLYRIDKTSNRLKMERLSDMLLQKDAIIKLLESDKETLIVSHIVEGKKPEDIPVSVPKEIIEKPVEELVRELAVTESPVSEAPPATEPVIEETVKPETKPDEVKSVSEGEPPQKKPAVELPKRISADDLELSYRRSSRSLRIQFNISNVMRSGSVAGHIFVILKPDPKTPDGWLVLPSTPLSGQKPSDYKKGQTFSINYFKTVFFEADNQREPIPYKTATVIIYDRNGELIFDKDFSVTVN
jgi:hypothetical protein